MTMKKIFQVDMHCGNCAMQLESIEDELPGIINISASYAKATLAVEFDEKKVAEAQILEAIRGKGYTAIPKLEQGK
jgi:copper chaperone CopZ